MPTFRYVAQTPEGREVRGTVQANSRLEASDAVRKQGYWLLELYAEPEPTTPIRAAQQSVWQPLFGGVPLKTLAVFFRQFATMLSAGVPMYQALETLGNQRGGNARLRRVLSDIRNSILAGERLADAFDKHPAVFSPIIRAMIRVGETSGALETILRRIADYLENELELRRLISRVTFYPKLVLFFAIVIPQLIPALITLVGAQGGAPVGQVLTGIAMTFAKILLVIFTIWAVFRLAMQSQGFRWSWGLFTVSLPWIGFTVRQLALARFARALSALYGAGAAPLASHPLRRASHRQRIPAQPHRTRRLETRSGTRHRANLRQHGCLPADGDGHGRHWREYGRTRLHDGQGRRVLRRGGQTAFAPSGVHSRRGGLYRRGDLCGDYPDPVLFGLLQFDFRRGG
jgi:type II secretory pathway component PulF